MYQSSIQIIFPLVTFLISLSQIQAQMSAFQLKKAFEEGGVVPDVIALTPEELLDLSYPVKGPVKPGDTLTLDQVQEKPTLSWTVDNPTDLFTLYMVNPDVPSREEPSEAEWQHWTVHNIPGNDIAKGTG